MPHSLFGSPRTTIFHVRNIGKKMTKAIENSGDIERRAEKIPGNGREPPVIPSRPIHILNFRTGSPRSDGTPEGDAVQNTQ